MALTTKNLIYYIVSYAWAGIGCSFAPAVSALVLLGPVQRRRGIVTALVAGLVTTIGWMLAGLEKTITARAVTFFVAMGLAVLVTLLTKKDEAPTAPACPAS